MSKQEAELIARLTEVFRETLDVEDLVVTRELTADEVEEWDSLAHVRLMIAVEREFGCRFPTTEVTKLSNVGDLVDLILRLT
ncbi:MAG: acyl carrier protein [Gammaproteobacteria bacterium]|nr:acyl carrier protein [Gammaproteobacteria bacterium]